MAGETNVTIGVDVTGLGDENHVRTRFTTTAPTATQRGYGTIAAANTVESLVLGQCTASLIQSLYIRAIDGALYVNPTTANTTVPTVAIASGDAAIFRPYNPAAVLSVGVFASVAGTNYEYNITGLSS